MKNFLKIYKKKIICALIGMALGVVYYFVNRHFNYAVTLLKGPVESVFAGALFGLLFSDGPKFWECKSCRGGYCGVEDCDCGNSAEE